MSGKKSMKVTSTVPTVENVVRSMVSAGRVLVNMVRDAKANEGKSMARSGVRRRDLRRGDSKRGGRMSLTGGEKSIVR